MRGPAKQNLDQNLNQNLNQNINHRKLNRGGLTHVPSPRWHGAVIAAILVLSMVTLLSYALLDWEWQQERGGWNYVVAIGGTLLFAPVLRRWRNDPRRLFATDELAGR